MSVKDPTKLDPRAIALIKEALKRGPLNSSSSGPAVKAAERLLKIAGFDVAVPDHVFDEKSLAAIEQLDAAAGKTADGEFDLETLSAAVKVVNRIRRHPKNDAFISRG